MMDKKVDAYRSSRERMDRKNLPWEEKNDLAKLSIALDFINKLNVEENSTIPKGNMLKYYTNLSDIEITISDFEFGK